MKNARHSFSGRQLQGHRILVTLSRDLTMDTARHFDGTQSALIEGAPV